MTAVDGAGIRELERESIRAFVAAVAFEGRVLDFGCGKMPYRDLVEACGASYQGFDRASFPSNVSVVDVGGDGVLKQREAWDAVLCNQVIQYVPDPFALLHLFRHLLRPGGRLVLTGPTNWAEVEPADIVRFTLAGIGQLLRAVGFEVERLERRASVELPGFELSLGYGAVARK